MAEKLPNGNWNEPKMKKKSEFEETFSSLSLLVHSDLWWYDEKRDFLRKIFAAKICVISTLQSFVSSLMRENNRWEKKFCAIYKKICFHFFLQNCDCQGYQFFAHFERHFNSFSIDSVVDLIYVYVFALFCASLVCLPSIYFRLFKLEDVDSVENS